MLIRKHLVPTALAISLVAGGVAFAFIDEVMELKEELALWEATHAADFSDVLVQLDDITGTVFRDVDEDDWFHPYVASLADWDIVSGFKDQAGRLTGEFKPSNPVTTAEILKMAAEAAEIDPQECLQFSGNLQGSHWASAYVWCALERHARVLARGDLNIDRPASRAEVLAILHDIFGDDVLPIYSSFSDTEGHEYEADIAHANLFGIVSGDTYPNGVEKGTFRPNDQINRAEAAKVIYERMKIEAREGETTL